MSELHVYSVRGRWPFPSDMLRRDGAQAASSEDQELINRLSGEVSDTEIGLDTVTIHLVIEANGRARPNAARWESFRWKVVGDESVAELAALRQSRRRVEALRQSAIAKLTNEEIEVLEWFAGRTLRSGLDS